VRGHLIIASLVATLGSGCHGHSGAAAGNATAQQPADPAVRAKWNALIAAHMEDCRTLPVCRKISAEAPCSCEGETFPCKESDFDDGPGCQVRLSCIEVASGDNTAPALHAPVLCGEFGEKWRAEAQQESELQRRFAATVPADLRVEAWPRTCDAAAELLLSRLDEGLRATLRQTPRERLIQFHHGWGQAIRNRLGMWGGNSALVKSCSAGRHDEIEFPDNASMALIEVVWRRVQQTGRLHEPRE
jgi:hypothetical protein